MLRQRIDTPYGDLVAIWTVHGLYSCSFDQTESSSAAMESGKNAVPTAPMLNSASELEQAFIQYFECGELKWSLSTLDWTGVPEFHRAVLQACFEIPTGTTLTYGDLALRAGSHKAARAVGSAMARNRWPILIPCHRVLGSTGKLTGYSGSGGLETKRKLIAFEQEHLTFELVCVSDGRAT